MKLHQDIYTEPDNSPDTLANLGPLKSLAGVFEGSIGHDLHPVDPSEDDGARQRQYFEKYQLRPIDPQTNGPQLLYGLRYHTHIVKLGQVETFHDQVGYWLWDPDQEIVYLTLAIPRGQIALYSGKVTEREKKFELRAERGSTTNGICSNPFLEKNFKTTKANIIVEILDNNSWKYDETTMLIIPDRDQAFAHTDRHLLSRVERPEPNPLMAGK
ncbi:FABP family protein [Candidatus Saccharibacteria bacterium]|nr:FABP family protein [Candidatus Saccharibacteria bacterium]MCB9835053.1 FABP family protein [Candidatus Nomurabacteria bacterium]